MSKTYTPVFSRYAEDDVKEIIEYYLYKNPDYAGKLLAALEGGSSKTEGVTRARKSST